MTYDNIIEDDVASAPSILGDFPRLSMKHDWHESIITKEEAMNRNFYIYFDNTSNENVSVPVSGRLYSTTIDFENVASMNDAFYSASSDVVPSSDMFYENGWEHSYDIGNYRISGVSASGVLGEEYAYLFLNDNLIKTAIVKMQKNSIIIDGTNEQLQYDCPCSIDFEVFESDEVDINDYLVQ